MFFFNSTSPLLHTEKCCSFFFRPSGHPGGGTHLSISHCCPGQLFWSNVHLGRHLRWCQMLLHKAPTVAFQTLNRQPFLGCRSVTLQRKPLCTGTGCDILRLVDLAHNCVCGFVSECGEVCNYSPTVDTSSLALHGPPVFVCFWGPISLRLEWKICVHWIKC